MRSAVVPGQEACQGGLLAHRPWCILLLQTCTVCVRLVLQALLFVGFREV